MTSRADAAAASKSTSSSSFLIRLFLSCNAKKLGGCKIVTSSCLLLFSFRWENEETLLLFDVRIEETITCVFNSSLLWLRAMMIFLRQHFIQFLHLSWQPLYVIAFSVTELQKVRQRINRQKPSLRKKDALLIVMNSFRNSNQLDKSSSKSKERNKKRNHHLIDNLEVKQQEQ